MIAPLATIDAADEAELVRVASRPGFHRWRAMVASTGGCADPIHLVGRSCMIDAGTGEVLNHYNTEDEPNRRLLVACRNRRASRCAPCAELYRRVCFSMASTSRWREMPQMPLMSSRYTGAFSRSHA